jgi:UPF0042 nucleotide-binding protein
LRNARFIIITGLSGSGKGLVLNSFEDMGYFCIDNLPTKLMPVFFELTVGEFSRVAVVADVREPNFVGDFPKVYSGLREAGYDIRLLFLEASEEVLIRRFSETRRPHPLAFQEPVITGGKVEKEKLAKIRELADEILDTSPFNVHELRKYIQSTYRGPAPDASIVISLISFGFKYGIPYNSDLLFDARFLPNPHFLQELRHKTGTDPEVVQYVLGVSETGRFLQEVRRLLDYLIPLYVREGKSYLTISIGCTGGKHRSVVIVNELEKLLSGKNVSITVTHRDIGKE